jgi:NO-binding membrane sensor protein with MHYT domain
MADIDIQWETGIVLLSIYVAFMGSYGCITLYEQYRICEACISFGPHDPYGL